MFCCIIFTIYLLSARRLSKNALSPVPHMMWGYGILCFRKDRDDGQKRSSRSAASWIASVPGMIAGRETLFLLPELSQRTSSQVIIFSSSGYFRHHSLIDIALIVFIVARFCRLYGLFPVFYVYHRSFCYTTGA